MFPPDTTEDCQKLRDALLKIELNSAFNFYNNNINKTALPEGSLNKYELSHLQQDNYSHQDCKELADPKREGNMELSLVLKDHNYISRELTSYLNKFNPHLVNLKQTLLKYLLEGLCELELPSESLNYQGIHRELNYYTNMVLKHFSSFILEKLPIMARTRECIGMEYNLNKKELHMNNYNNESGRITPLPRHEILDEVKFIQYAEKLKILFTKYNFFDNNLTIKLSPFSDLSESNLNSSFKKSTKQNDLKDLSLIDNCSEPLEYFNCHELHEDVNIDVMEGENYILQHILNFANQLCEDCEIFKSSKISIRDKILRYIYAKYNEFKTIIKEINIFCEKSIQTENFRKTAYNHLCQKEEITSPPIRTSSSSSDYILKLNSDYDDCVPLTNYIKSEIFESNEAPYKDFSSLELDDDIKVKSALENDCSTLASVNVHEPNTTNGIDKNPLNGENVDKEIQRLINLNSLEKKQLSPTNKSSRPLSTEKLENGSDKLNILKDTTVQKEVAADESNLSDNENETFTEEEFLERYNNNLKLQLLRASSSDSESMSNAIDYPLVEKFLKNSSDRDTSENEDCFKIDETEGSVNKSNLSTTYKSPVEEEIRACEMLTNNSNIPFCDENGKIFNNVGYSTDCMYYGDNIRERYGSSRKLFRKMDPQTGKMNRYEDNFISLSSESDNSDVEAVDNVFNEVNRIIKPMLRHDQLATETLNAQKLEANRIKRLDEKHSILNNILKVHPAINQNKNELILDFNADTNTFIGVHPELAKLLKPHQVDGVKFMYDSCYGSIDMLKKSPGSGCILAHCMGLGKTLQVIALIHTVIAFKELKTTKILVLCPKSTVMNWADEMQRWIGPLNSKNMKLFTFNDLSDINEKLKTLKEWSLSSHEKAGCLLIGYEAFRFLVFYHSYKAKLNKTPLSSDDIRESVNKYLFNPGADLVVCDEGHVIKNRKSAISLAVSKIVTPRRIILTGTPIQNNLKEYYSMVNFIKPLFLGTEKEFANLYANPIKNGQHKDSSKRDIKVMKQRSFVLHKKLSKFVQRKEAKLLKAFLPQKYEYVLFIPMSIVQNNLYEFILDAILKREDNRGRSLITDYTCLRKIWTHPKVLEDAWKNATINKTKKDAKKQQALHSDEDQPDDVYDSQTGIMSVTHDWWRHLVTKSDLETILPSKKIRTMFEILRMCRELGEKCLIFSAFVAVLNVVEYFFKKINEQDADTLKDLNLNHSLHNLSMVLGQDYYRLDGKTPKSLRHEMIKSFNSPLNKKARVFLISAKAGGQGINLIGANRVIILDTSWNPSNDQQNIFRVFRLGQQKNCFIYRLLAMGTMEEKVYSRSVTKQAMSFRVVDEQQIDRHYNMAELAELYTLTKPDYEKRSMPVFPKDNILANLLLNNPDLVYKYHEHDSLLENQVEQELSEQEKSDAWTLYERDHNFTTEFQGIPFLDALLYQQLS